MKGDKDFLVAVCEREADRSLLGLCSSEYVWGFLAPSSFKKQLMTQGLVVWLESACTPSAFWCLWDMGKYGLVGCE